MYKITTITLIKHHLYFSCALFDFAAAAQSNSMLLNS